MTSERIMFASVDAPAAGRACWDRAGLRIVSVAFSRAEPHVRPREARGNAPRVAEYIVREGEMRDDERETEPVDESGAEEERPAPPPNADAVESDAPTQHGRDEDGPDADGDAGAVGDEVARLKEAMLRMQADMANREKRLERDMSKARKYALESLMRDFVQVLDSMDQALASADGEDANAAYEGMELTRKQALQVLGSHGLEVLDPVGETFDPTWHEAMSTQPTEAQEPDTVFQVLQKGYRLNDRLIRPARVIVAKSP
jgi:molecular chaperone GrpE